MNKVTSFYCPKKDESCTLNLGNQYQIIQKVGEGSYGEVFKVLDIENSKLMIVKRQKKAESHRSGFQNEHKILSEVTNVTEGKVAAPLRLNVGKLNQTSQYDYFMMDCLGMNLEQLVSKYGPFKISTVKYIGWSIVNKLEALHKLGCLHRDVKTQNILIGDNLRRHQVYLIDYGLATKYMINGKQVQKRKYSGLIGTARFASLAAHQGTQQSPKDDLQSLGYVLSYCLKGKLEWQNVTDISSKEEKFQRIKYIKSQVSLDVLAFDYPCLKEYFSYVKKRKYQDKINYEYLKGLFEVKGREHQCFEWCPGNCNLKKKEQVDEQVEAKQVKIFLK